MEERTRWKQLVDLPAIGSKLPAAGDANVITVEFGITVSAGAGVVVAHTSVEANFP